MQILQLPLPHGKLPRSASSVNLNFQRINLLRNIFGSPKELTLVQYFTLTFFHLIKGPHLWIQFYLHFPYLMSFLFCFSIHTYLVFVWFSIPFWLPTYMEESYGIFKNLSTLNDVFLHFTIEPRSSATTQFPSLEP